MIEKVSFDPYNFQITRLSANVYHLNTKTRLTMLCLSGFEQYSRWVPLINNHIRKLWLSILKQQACVMLFT